LGAPEIDAKVPWLTRSNNGDANEIDGDDDPNRTAALSVGCSAGDGQREESPTTRSAPVWNTTVTMIGNKLRRMATRFALMEFPSVLNSDTTHEPVCLDSSRFDELFVNQHVKLMTKVLL
jgi:hypothetical protein